jgi:hypothetical protein
MYSITYVICYVYSPIPICKDNIKMIIKLRCDNTDWIFLAQATYLWRAFLNAVVKLGVQ